MIQNETLMKMKNIYIQISYFCSKKLNSAKEEIILMTTTTTTITTTYDCDYKCMHFQENTRREKDTITVNTLESL